MAKRTILRLALILCFMLTRILSVPKPLKGCIAKEQAALLSFKEGLEDTSNRLSTWTGDDCCVWKGVICSKKIGHVVRLDLRNTYVDDFGEPDIDYALGGKLSSSLVALRHLNYLDLSWNYFNESQIPEFIGSMSNLRYLNLSGTSFIGSIPPQLGNLSNLIYLDLNSEYSFYSINPIYSKDLAWLPHLPLLEYLDMTNVNINTVANWAQIVTMLPSLKYLYFSYCMLQKPTFSPSLSNLSNLVALDINRNYFGNITFLDWVGNLTSLKYLDMSSNDLNVLPGMFNNLCNIKELDLSYNLVNIDITKLVHVLSRCLRSKLQSLNLESTNLVGNLSSLLEHMTSLRTLNLFNNYLTGPIPYNIRAIRLSYLNLGYNFLDGAVSKDHFVNLLNLQWLKLDGNNLIIDQKWIPPISLRWVSLSSCKLGSKFPPWIQLTNIIGLDISNTSIVGKVPEWFWNTSSHFLYLDLSNNQISGNIHKAFQFTSFTELYLQNNLFEGPIPPLPESLISLDLSNNSLSGPLPASIWQLHNLQQIDLSSNLLTGIILIPMCWNTSKDLEVSVVSYFTLTRLNSLNLSGNHLSGNIPMNIGAMQALESLDLSINILSGEIPSSLSNLTRLSYLNFSYNNLSGRIPSGNQLQTFDESSYIGNSGLYGPPLSKHCSGNGITIPQGNESRKEDGSDIMSRYLGICIGFIFELWLVFCVFLFKRKYRIAYFRAIDDLYDWVYVFVVLRWKRAFGK